MVISVDGIDWRFLRGRDKLGLRIPDLRRLLASGWSADGVVGVWPAIIWPSHTSILTGARPDQHGIRGNKRPASEGGDYYWTIDLLKREPLWACAGKAGLTAASITWPVAKDAALTFNLPEYFHRRNGGSMELATSTSAATAGLVDGITATSPPSRSSGSTTARALATLYLLKAKQPDLLLVHLVDLDSQAHDRGPFAANANAVLEPTDELIGDMMHALPADTDIIVTSGHGFERLDHIANPGVLLAGTGAKGQIEAMGGILVARDADGAAFLLGLAAAGQEGIGRTIPRAELGKATKGAYLTPPPETGEHGFWPLRRDYAASS